MILVSGPSVFSGYIDPTISDPFVEIEGISWYKTGDLGSMDRDGYITITGRLKRFIKIAGEMISLPFIETILRSQFESVDAEAPEIAVEALESDGGTRICVFSIHPLELSEIHDALRSGGAPGIVRIYSVVVLPVLPVLGTGKLDYKELKKYILNI